MKSPKYKINVTVPSSRGCRIQNAPFISDTSTVDSSDPSQVPMTELERRPYFGQSEPFAWNNQQWATQKAFCRVTGFQLSVSQETTWS
jgi:hypothetical protein